jgi:hypothetical protein
MGPTPYEATPAEACIALPALCMECAGIEGHVVKPVESHAKLPQASCMDKPGKASALMMRETALNKLKVKTGASEGHHSSRFKERWIGDLKEGLYPGDSGIFRMNDDTLALKSNVDGVISKKPVCGHPFREKDGSVSLYEYGILVQSEVMPK